MASLTGQTISSTYDSILKVTDNGPITSSLKTITDGLGTSSSLQLSTIAAEFSGTIVGQSSIDIAGTIYQRDDIAVLNKLENSWLHWATRNTAGSDSVINLSNIGSLTLNSTISNGTYIYTLPSATGTLALTSALGSYLPLAGGTLTGALNGTSAVFSSTISAVGGSGTGVTSTTTTGTALRGTSSGAGEGLFATSDSGVGANINSTTGKSAQFTSAGSITTISVTNNSTGDIATFANSGGTVFSVKNNGTLSNGTYIYTLPSATGTLALTSALSNYVDLTTDQTIGGFKTFSNSVTIANGTAHGLNLEIGTSGNYSSLKAATSGGSTNILLPASSGTLALTSALSSYLPLAGGTLTGALSGTSATFSGAFEVANGAGVGTLRVTGNRGNADAVQVGNIEFYNSFSSRLAGEVRGVTGTGGTQSNSGQLVFYTNDNGSYAERLRIAATGNVGIGTTSPSGKLHVSGDGISTNLIRLQHTGSGTNGFFDIGVTSTEATLVANYSTTAIPMTFLTGASERMRITSGGNVGIGTTSPGEKLTVNGSIGLQNSGTQYWHINSTSGARLDFVRSGVAERVSITSDGNVLIGTTTDAGYKLDVNGTFRASGAATFSSTIDLTGNITTSASSSSASATLSGIQFKNTANTGNVKASIVSINGADSDDMGLSFRTSTNSTNISEKFKITGAGVATFSSSVTATAFFESSDSRLKTLISDNYQTNGIESILPRLYEKGGIVELGYYAQDVQEVLPSAVVERMDNFLDLSYRQVHTAKIANLENRIKQLEDLIKQLI